MKKINIVIIIGLIVVITLIIIFSFKGAPIAVNKEVDISTTTLLIPDNFPNESIPDLEPETATNTTTTFSAIGE